MSSGRARGMACAALKRTWLRRVSPAPGNPRAAGGLGRSSESSPLAQAELPPLDTPHWPCARPAVLRLVSACCVMCSFAGRTVPCLHPDSRRKAAPRAPQPGPCPAYVRRSLFRRRRKLRRPTSAQRNRGRPVRLRLEIRRLRRAQARAARGAAGPKGPPERARRPSVAGVARAHLRRVGSTWHANRAGPACRSKRSLRTSGPGEARRAGVAARARKAWLPRPSARCGDGRCQECEMLQYIDSLPCSRPTLMNTSLCYCRSDNKGSAIFGSDGRWNVYRRRRQGCQEALRG
jgi:hypothetical protein